LRHSRIGANDSDAVDLSVQKNTLSVDHTSVRVDANGALSSRRIAPQSGWIRKGALWSRRSWHYHPTPAVLTDHRRDRHVKDCCVIAKNVTIPADCHAFPCCVTIASTGSSSNKQPTHRLVFVSCCNDGTCVCSERELNRRKCLCALPIIIVAQSTLHQHLECMPILVCLYHLKR
jgi:hypothetical protein